MAKLTLLERGLLEAANGLDSLHPVPKRTQEDEDEKFTSTEDTEEDFHKRIQIYVAANLVRAPQSRRDHYKDGLVYQERKAVILEFIKATLLKKCQNEDCNAYVTSVSRLLLITDFLSQPCTFSEKGRTHESRRVGSVSEAESNP